MRSRVLLTKIYQLNTPPSALASAICLRGDSGQSVVETALLLPFLFFVVTGILAFGAALNNYAVLVNATSVGARQLAIVRGQQFNGSYDPCAQVVSVVQAAAPTINQASITYAYVLNSVTYTGTSCSSASQSSGAASNLQQGDTVQLTLTYPCLLKVYGIILGGSSCVMTAKSTEIEQ